MGRAPGAAGHQAAATLGGRRRPQRPGAARRADAARAATTARSTSAPRRRRSGRCVAPVEGSSTGHCAGGGMPLAAGEASGCCRRQGQGGHRSWAFVSGVSGASSWAAAARPRPGGQCTGVAACRAPGRSGRLRRCGRRAGPACGGWWRGPTQHRATPTARPVGAGARYRRARPAPGRGCAASSAETASSRTSSCGSAAKARASARRWRSPPENSWGRRVAALAAGRRLRAPGRRPRRTARACRGTPRRCCVHRRARVEAGGRVLEHRLDGGAA